ncbi:conjugative transfer ATPase [Uliginosibacterium gangwonense]|uniref:conjugative transfer ATPase n=1 Tax=Uliginosibacterium gangwonense TaxID=392736 RepID=UPI00035C753D|nr:conjugative transfer ATPase [Uliginosibacterium gangwonense]
MGLIEKLLQRVLPDPDPAEHGKADNGASVQIHSVEPGRDPKKLPGITEEERRRMASRPPSFVDMLPWIECDEEGIFLLDDLVSCGMMFELAPIPTEAASEDYLQARMHEVQSALGSLPEYDQAEWIIQFFCNDDLGIDDLAHQFAEYVLSVNTPERGEEILHSAFTQAYLAELTEHLEVVSKAAGCFEDKTVSGNIWRGQRRRVRVAIYRRFPKGYDFEKEQFSPRDQVKQAAASLLAGLKQAGVTAQPMGERAFYEWLMPWFNPRPFGDLATTPSEVLRRCPYSGETAAERPFGVDLSDLLFLAPPRSDSKNGMWYFNERPMRAMVLQNMTRNPEAGHFTAERQYAKHYFARFDRLPPGAMLSCTIVLHPQDLTRDRVTAIRETSRAKTSEARATAAEADKVLQWAAKGDKLYPFYMCLYLSGEDEADLRNKAAEVNASLQSSGLRLIDPRHELLGCDVFMRGLPMNFDPVFDLREMRRSRLAWASQIASILPVYGRARGTGHPGISMWNRGGEQLTFDPLNKHDRKANAHLLMLGPTGAGKSASLNYIAQQVMAIYRPRLVIVDAGKSFGLLVEYFKSMGLSTYVVELNAGTDVSLPPFANANLLLDQIDSEAALMAQLKVGEHDLDVAPLSADAAKPAPGEDTEEEAAEEETEEADVEKRDLLGEMIIAARLMITGGEPAEEAKMGRADRYLIAQAIIQAAREARAAGKPHPRTEDVGHTLMQMRNANDLGISRQARAEEMGQAMLVFCQDLRGQVFNRYGTAWPDADVTLVEMGTFANEGYEDALSVAYMSLLNHVQATAERTHYEGRPIIMLTDEGHIITRNPLVSPAVVKGTKMWRKLGAWFWLATQNMKDFPDQATRMLSMCEWWILLTMERDEIEDVARFRTLSDEERRMMESASKEPPKYTEGVVLAKNLKALFRNVPPALSIALAMTEQHEKAARAAIMREKGCSELDAVFEIARQLTAKRGYSK